jgi:Domain of unknown function (DUF4129)
MPRQKRFQEYAFKEIESDMMVTKSDPRKRLRILAGLLALAVFPLVAMTAFYAGTHISNVPGGHFGAVNAISQKYILANSTNTITSSGLTITQRVSYTQTVNFPNLVPQINLPLGGIATGSEIALIVAMVFVLALLFRGLRQGQASKFKTVENQDLAANRSEVASILEEGAARIKSGIGYKAAVLDCYRAISEILEDKTGIDGRSLTAREFETSVSHVLQLNSPYLRDLTGLFEVAKYSTREITEDEANHAIRSLKSLSEILRQSEFNEEFK